jgi:hypothetical protein
VTLLTTEIHQHDTPDAVIVFAADRRISIGGMRDSEQPKIFQIQKLRAGIGYFGLAEVPDASTREPMAVWLQRFISASRAATLEELAQQLAAGLNAAIPDELRQTARSGFHLCGFAAACRPEFWYVRNIDDTPDQNPTGVYEAREDFQARDAPLVPQHATQVYTNGDIRAHVCAWEPIDKAFEGLLSAPDFRAPRTRTDYERWVQFKMEVIAHFYEAFCKNSIIGRPVDVFSLVWSG